MTKAGQGKRGPIPGLGQVLLILLLLFAFWASAATAQDADTNPLRPADTSSPRDTLRTFLDEFGSAVQDWQQGNLSSATYRGFERATNALDFRSTPNGDSWAVRMIRAMMLREILDRVELPPDEEIPGVEEAAEDDINSWTIPNTRITLRRIEEGPRAGAFVFSARTVEQLGKYYRQVADLPYKPGAIEGLLENYLAADLSYSAATKRIRSRLKPISTSSPRWLLQGFLDSMNRAFTLIHETEAALRAEPPTITLAEAREAEERAALYLQRAAGGLDLSEVPPAQREVVGLAPDTRINFTLGSYNAGRTRIQRLRREAGEEGLDPDRWFGNVERIVRRRVGLEPVEYVGNIRRFHLKYQLMAAARAERAKARQRLTQ